MTEAAAFPATADYVAWQLAVERTAKAAATTLAGRSRDGVPIGPLYPMGYGRPIWRSEDTVRIVQRVDHPDPTEANALVLADLEGGASGLTLVLEGSAAARGFGLSIATVDELRTALAGVQLDAIQLRFEVGSATPPQAWTALADLIDRDGLPASKIDVDFGLDPLGLMAATGCSSEPWPRIGAQAAAAVRALRGQGFGSPVLRADGRPHHEAGASEAQELAALLATGVEYLRVLEQGGLSLDEARAALSFTLVADADLFLTLAKFRALRQLWARIEAACGLQPLSMRLHGETAFRMQTIRDPWTNLLRAGLACAAALLGGADSVTTLPHIAALELPDAAARRFARNMPLILLEEAGLGRIGDPATGSGAFEALTDALCLESWRLLQVIESEGGIAAALGSGSWQARVAAVQGERDKDLRDGTATIVGTTRFADPEEKLAPGALGRVGAHRPTPDLPRLPSRRDAEPFEAGARA